MASGYGLESPSPGGARSQGKGRKISTGLRGLVPRSRFPLAAERPLYSELVNTRQGHATTHTPWRRRRQSQPLRPASLPRRRLGPPPRSVRSPVCFSMVVRRARGPTSPPSLFSVAAPPPSRLLCPILSSSPTVIPCPTPRARLGARAAALDRHAAPPREVGPALFGRGFAPAPAVSLSSSARPYAPTPLSKAASAHLSPPPTTDPKPPLGPSGLGFPVRRWVQA